ncbi:MAG TPA: type II toxin-antitoxin system RelE/ParE family toxin [Candidatus Kapabacteria bacterium]|nr:type II toxin-antitoxin system RelE/ParE family toxin [Candidatus Kapabacteria bacterium]
MKVEFLDSFGKDIDHLRDSKVKENIISIIEECENARTLSDIVNVKKLKGYKNAYRIRIKEYRVGFYFENGSLSSHEYYIEKKFTELFLSL